MISALDELIKAGKNPLAVTVADLAESELKRLRAGVQRVIDDSDWCPVCDHHPGSDGEGHAKDCPMRSA